MSLTNINEPRQTPPMKPHLMVQPGTQTSTATDVEQREAYFQDLTAHKHKYERGEEGFACTLCGNSKYSLAHELVVEPDETTTPPESPEEVPDPSTETDLPLNVHRNPGSTALGGAGLGASPTHNWVVIEPVEKEEKTASGIAFPQIASRRSNEGIVLAVGPGRREFRPDRAEMQLRGELPPDVSVWDYVPIDLRVGDRVLYVRWAAYALTVDGRKCFAVEEQNVVMVAEPWFKGELEFWAERH